MFKVQIYDVKKRNGVELYQQIQGQLNIINMTLKKMDSDQSNKGRHTLLIAKADADCGKVATLVRQLFSYSFYGTIRVERCEEQDQQEPSLDGFKFGR